MDHQEAEHIQAADRYVLRELSAAEREQFEEHFFTCPQCAEEVRAGSLFEANARAVLLEEAQRPVAEKPARAQASWWAWLNLQPVAAASLAAVCLLGFTAGYQALVVVPRLETQLAEVRVPQPYQSFALYPPSRGDEPALTIHKGRRFFGLYVSVTSQQKFPAYRAEFVKAGITLYSVPSTAPERPGDPLEFLVPTSSFPPGEYTMVLRGLDDGSPEEPGTEIEKYQFRIKHQ